MGKGMKAGKKPKTRSNGGSGFGGGNMQKQLAQAQAMQKQMEQMEPVNMLAIQAYDEVKAMMDFIGYADGMKDLIQISEEIRQPVKVLIPIAKKLLKEGLITSED